MSQAKKLTKNTIVRSTKIKFDRILVKNAKYVEIKGHRFLDGGTYIGPEVLTLQGDVSSKDLDVLVSTWNHYAMKHKQGYVMENAEIIDKEVFYTYTTNAPALPVETTKNTDSLLHIIPSMQEQMAVTQQAWADDDPWKNAR